MSDESNRFRLSNHPGLYYEAMLADQLRMQRYRAAITQSVKPGDIVADLGTGLGVLAIMAAQAGAARVYAVDNRSNVLQVTAGLVDANKVSDRITLVDADVREVQLEEPVDIIVNELIGDFGTDENIHECVRAFAARNLKPGGSILPSKLRTLLAPVQYQDEFRGIWHDNYQGLNLSPVAQLPTQPEPVMRNLRHNPILLARAQVLEDIEFCIDMPARQLEYSASFTAQRAGTLQGFMGFFEAELRPGVNLANHPVYPACHWQTWHWPLQPPLSIAAGQQLTARVHARENVTATGWTMDWQLN